MKFEIEYFADVWADEEPLREVEFAVDAGVIVALSTTMGIKAPAGATFAVLWVNGEVDSRWARDPESLLWRLAK